MAIATDIGDKLKVTSDYGKAHCLNCGGELNSLRICKQCNVNLDAEDTVFIPEIKLCALCHTEFHETKDCIFNIDNSTFPADSSKT
jgi:hypothetical protein